MASVFIAIDKTDIENGCLKVILMHTVYQWGRKMFSMRGATMTIIIIILYVKNQF